jgi:hypothetical protein
MENKYEYGIDWNIYENLKCFKEGGQNIHKTVGNIKLLFGKKFLNEKQIREIEFLAQQEIQRIRLENNE